MTAELIFYQLLHQPMTNERKEWAFEFVLDAWEKKLETKSTETQ